MKWKVSAKTNSIEHRHFTLFKRWSMTYILMSSAKYDRTAPWNIRTPFYCLQSTKGLENLQSLVNFDQERCSYMYKELIIYSYLNKATDFYIIVVLNSFHSECNQQTPLSTTFRYSKHLPLYTPYLPPSCYTHWFSSELETLLSRDPTAVYQHTCI